MDKNDKTYVIEISPSDLDRDLIVRYFITKEHKKQDSEKEEDIDLIWILATLLSSIQVILIIISTMGIIEKMITILLGGIVWFLYTWIVDHI